MNPRKSGLHQFTPGRTLRPMQETSDGEANNDQNPPELHRRHRPFLRPRKRTMTEKMSVRKYDPVGCKHVEYKEGKIK